MSEAAAAPVRVARRVRFGDCDPAGMVFTPRYADFVFDAVEQWLEAAIGHGIVEQLRGRETPLPVRAYALDLRRSLHPGDRFTCSVWVEKIGSRSFTLLVTGERGAELAFVGRMTCVATDARRTAPAALGDELRGRLETYVSRCGPAPDVDAAG